MFIDHVKLSWLSVWGVCLVFLTIYQHNLIIKRNYEKQRFTKMRIKLESKRNELYRLLLHAHNPEIVAARAQHEWGMCPLRPSQVLTVTAAASVGLDFVGTTSQQTVLQALGLLDSVVTGTGRKNACA